MLYITFFITVIAGGLDFHEVRQRVLPEFSNPGVQTRTINVYVTINIDQNFIHFANWLH